MTPKELAEKTVKDIEKRRIKREHDFTRYAYKRKVIDPLKRKARRTKAWLTVNKKELEGKENFLAS